MTKNEIKEHINKSLFEGWGIHITRQILLWILSKEKDGIDITNFAAGIKTAFAKQNPEELADYWVYQLNFKFDEEFRNWLLCASLGFGMKLHPELLKEIEEKKKKKKKKKKTEKQNG
jgi:hypothetical protein